MIDKNDIHTVDAFAQKRRGRPRTGKAVSPKERKAKQRRKALDNLSSNQAEHINFNALPVSALLEYLPRAINRGRTSVVDGITKRLKYLSEQKRKEIEKKLREK